MSNIFDGQKPNPVILYNKSIKKLADRPNRSPELGGNGLTAAGLKAQFDAAVEYLGLLFNGLIDLLKNATAAANLGAVNGETVTTVQDYIDYCKGEIDHIKTAIGYDEDTNTSELITALSDAIDAIETALAGKVDKVAGKGLSANDFTNALKIAYDAAVTASHSHANKAALDGLTQTKLNELFKDVSYNGTNGVITFTKYDGSTKAIDLPLELIISDGYYDEETMDIVLVLANGSTIAIPMDSFAGSVSPYTLPIASGSVLGGVKAKAKTTESVEVAVDSTGKLYVAEKADEFIKGSASILTTDWEADTTYEDYGYRASVPVTGLTASHVGDVYFDDTADALGILKASGDQYSGGFYVYASEIPDITIVIVGYKFTEVV